MKTTRTGLKSSLLIVGIGLVLNGYSQSFLTNGLVAYYPFNGSANDVSGNGHNPSLASNATLTTDRFGVPSGAYFFENGIMQFPNIPLNLAGPCSFAMWMKYQSGTVSGELTTTDFGCNGGPQIYASSTNMVVWHCAYGPNGALPFSDVPSLTNGWHQLFVSVSSGGQTQVYKDGQLTSDTLVTLWPITTLVTLTLGASGNTATLPAIHATVTLDDVRIYNRALSANEVAQLYTYESGPWVPPFTNGLVAYYPFDGNTRDYSGNSNDCTTAGGVAYETNRFGVPSQCLQLDGVDAYVTTTNMPALNNVFSYTGWIKVDGNAPWEQSFACYGVNDEPLTGANALWNFTYDPLYSRWDFWDRNQWSYYIPANPSRDPTKNWAFVAIVYGNGFASTFVNGVLESSTPVTLPLPLINNRRLTFGASYPVYPQVFNGRIDDVRIYNRSLSGSEVQQLYQYESGPRVDLIKAVKPSFSYLSPGMIYQMQISGDLNTWTNQGAAFTATSTNMIYPQYFDVENWGSLYFRLQVSP